MDWSYPLRGLRAGSVRGPGSGVSRTGRYATACDLPIAALAMACVLVCVLVPMLAGAADEAPAEVEWAIQAPLALRSLTLDVAAAGDRLVAVGDRGHILVSDDSGGSWRQVDVPTRAMLTGVFFADAERGWAVGHDGVILRSQDGGESWEVMRWAPEEETPLLDVWFHDPEHGIAVGAYGLFLATSDGGTTWDERSISEDDSHLNRIAAWADTRLYLAAERGMIHRSDDGGASWIMLPSPYDGSFFGALALTGDSVLVFGLRGHMYRSDDGGESWGKVETGTIAMLTDGITLTDGRVLVVGLGGTVLLSSDGGRSFEGQEQPNRLGIASVVQAPDGGVVVVGEGGVRRLELTGLAGAGQAQQGGGQP